MFRQRFLFPLCHSSDVPGSVLIEYTILVLAVPKRPELGDVVPSSGLRDKHLTHEPYNNSNNVFELQPCRNEIQDCNRGHHHENMSV